MSSYLRRLAIVIFLLGLGGCANLTAIQEFGRLSADTAGFTQQSNAFASSPLHRRKFTFEADIGARAKLDTVHAARKPMMAELQLNQQGLASYMDTLADLAGDDIPSANSDIAGLVDAAVKGGHVHAQKAAAAKSIGQLLSRAALGWLSPAPTA